MSAFALDCTELLGKMDICLRIRILPLSASKAEFAAASHKYEKELRVLSGFDRIGRGANGDAIALFTDALVLDPLCMSAFLGRAIAAHQMHHYERAHRDYDRVLQLNQDCVLALCGRGWTRLAFGQCHAALSDCTAAASLMPTFSAPHNSVGVVRTVAGDWANAQLDYVKALKFARSDRERVCVLVNRGILQYAQGQWSGAATDLRIADELCAELACPSRLLLWHCHARTGDRKQADKDLAVHLSKLKRLPKHRNSGGDAALGELLLRKSSEEDILSMLDTEEIAFILERRCEAHFHLGCLALLEGRVHAAANHFRESLDTSDFAAPEYVCAQAELSRLKH